MSPGCNSYSLFPTLSSPLCSSNPVQSVLCAVRSPYNLYYVQSVLRTICTMCSPYSVHSLLRTTCEVLCATIASILQLWELSAEGYAQFGDPPMCCQVDEYVSKYMSTGCLLRTLVLVLFGRTVARTGGNPQLGGTGHSHSPTGRNFALPLC